MKSQMRLSMYSNSRKITSFLRKSRACQTSINVSSYKWSLDPNNHPSIVMHFSVKYNCMAVADDTTVYCYSVESFLASEDLEI